MNQDGEFDSGDSSNMMQEFIEIDEVSEGVAVALHSFEPSAERLYCFDTGSNVTICNIQLASNEGYVEVNNRGIGTAQTGGVLRVQGIFSLGDIKDIRHCKGSRVNLLGGNTILDCGCRQQLFGTKEEPKCQIIRRVNGYDDFIIDCTLFNGLWWITESQFY